MLIARSRFLCCERSFWQLATMPVANMRDAHRRIRRIDVLPAFAARAVSVGANVFRLDDDLNAVVDFRRNKNARKRSMPALGLIEWRNPHQAVHADLAAQQAKGILAVHARTSPTSIPASSPGW